jgi:hypothetical protein
MLKRRSACNAALLFNSGSDAVFGVIFVCSAEDCV